MTYGRYPNLKKNRSHGSAHRPVSMASTGIIGPRTFNYYPCKLSPSLSEPQSTSWPHKLHFSAQWPRLQGSSSSLRLRHLPETTVGCMVHHTYDYIYEKNSCQSASHSSCTGSFRAELDLRKICESVFFLSSVGKNGLSVCSHKGRAGA